MTLFLYISMGLMLGLQLKSSEKIDLVYQTNKWIAPEWADTLTNTNLKNPTWIANGKIIFNGRCVVCHGENGRGDGESGFGLSVPPGDLNDEFTQRESDGSIFWKITNGREPMPNFMTKLTDQKRWEVVAYIRALQRDFIKKQKAK